MVVCADGIRFIISLVWCRHHLTHLEQEMSTNSKPVHDAVLALRAAAKAALAFGNAASMLIEVLEKVADLGARIDTLERVSAPAEGVDVSSDRQSAGSQLSTTAKVRSHVDTNTAAVMLGRAPQTLRKWACYDDGPLRPARVNGRLAWAIADIHRLLRNERRRQ